MSLPRFIFIPTYLSAEPLSGSPSLGSPHSASPNRPSGASSRLAGSISESTSSFAADSRLLKISSSNEFVDKKKLERFKSVSTSLLFYYFQDFEWFI